MKPLSSIVMEQFPSYLIFLKSYSHADDCFYPENNLNSTDYDIKMTNLF